MTIEKYGASASLVASKVSRAVDTSTRLIFIGTAGPSTAAGTIADITSWDDAKEKLGVDKTTDCMLRDGIIAALDLAGLAQCTCIVANTQTVAAEALRRLYDGTTIATNLVCVPRNFSGIISNELLEECDGIKSYAVRGCAVGCDELEPTSLPDGASALVSAIVSFAEGKVKSDHASACFLVAETSDGLIIDEAAIRAAYMAKSDAEYGCPARVGGMLPVSGIKAQGIFDGEGNFVPYDLRKSHCDELSSAGICCLRKIGGQWYTYGDHTSAYTNGMADERGRFENTMRMQCMIANRFVIKYATQVDKPMTLGMRNDIIAEQSDYLEGLVAIGALVGRPKVAFVAEDNTKDDIVHGHFTWAIDDTPTIPAKSLHAKIAFTSEGLSVYTA